MLVRCPHCSMKVIVKQDGICPNCKNNTSRGLDSGAGMATARMPVPVHVLLAICIYAAAAGLFIYTVFHYDFDLISFFMLSASLLSLLGIFSLVSRKKWSRKYNVIFQIVLCVCGLVFGTVSVAGGLFSGPMMLAIVAGIVVQVWVTVGFIRNKKVIAFLDRETGFGADRRN